MNGVRVRDVHPGDVRVALHQVGYEQKAYWRNPMAAVFTFAFPIIFLVVVGTSAGASKVPGSTLRYEQYVVVAMLTFGLIAACYTNLAMAICTRRDTGVLKRCLLYTSPSPRD